MNRLIRAALLGATAVLCTPASADENLFGYIKGAEPLPKGARELYAVATRRSDKGQGHYEAWDLATELEFGATDRLAVSAELKAMAIDTSGLIINGYLPKDEQYGPRPSGAEAALKYNFLSPAKDDFGLSLYSAFSYSWLDPHSGQDKDTLSVEQRLLLQKYFLDGQLILAGNLGLETTHANRAGIDNLPEGFEWPTGPEMEIELLGGTGLSYRFAPGWFAGVEAYYEEERETEVGLERWSVQAGPNLHYGSARWWTTLSWMPQIRGGGEQYDGQDEQDLHLIEKTKQELRLKLGYNF